MRLTSPFFPCPYDGEETHSEDEEENAQLQDELQALWAIFGCFLYRLMVRDFTCGKKPARSTSVSLHDSVQKSRESNGNPAHKRQKLVVSTGGGTIVIDPMPMRMQKATQGMLAMRMQRATRFAVRVPAA